MKLKDGFVSIVKGAILGFSATVPFVSVGAVACGIGMFDKIILSIKDFFKDIKKNIFILLPLIIGFICGYFAVREVMPGIISKYKFQVICLFIGLIMGGIPFLKSSIDKKKKVSLIVFFALFTGFLLFNLLYDYKINISFDDMLMTIFYGIVSGVCLLSPGFSEYLINKMFGVTSFTSFLGNNNFTLVYALGGILGIVLVSMIFTYLYKNYKNIINYMILSLMLSSVVILIFSIGEFTINFTTIFTSILTFLWGFILARKIREE